MRRWGSRRLWTTRRDLQQLCHCHCENRAAKCRLDAHGPRYAALDPVYLGDELFSRQLLCLAALDAGGHFIFVCKPASHPLIQEYLNGVELGLLERTVKRGKQRFIHRYRWLYDVPLARRP